MTRKIGFCSFVLFSTLLSADTTVLYNPASPATGPFPSDVLTIPNSAEATGKQINMSLASCGISQTLSSCINANLLNQLDGFSVNSQIMVCFSGPVDVSTLKPNIKIFPLTRFAASIAINQILWDPNTNCMYAKPDQVLPEQSQYLLTVTNSVLDSQEKKTKPDPQFTACMSGGSAYCSALDSAIDGLSSSVTHNLVSASLFTTMKATDWVQKAHTFENLSTSPVANLPAGNPTQFSISQVSAMSWIPDYGPGQPTTPQSVPMSVLSNVDSVAFGFFLSPNFINTSGVLAGTITVTPTGPAQPIAMPVGVPGFPSGFVPVSYHLFLPPARLKAPGGFPVVIYGHGLGDSQFGASTFIANTLAAAGIATLSIEILGHGFGPNGIVQLALNSGSPAIVSTPGRGIPLGAGPIGPTNGCVGPGPIGVRDCAKQTAVDLFAMYRTIQATNGLGVGLNPSRVYYIGQSFGSIYGTVFHAMEPGVKAAVLNVGGGTSVAVSRLTPLGRIIAEVYLGGSNPPLLNVPPAPSQAYFHDLFNDNYVYRDVAPVTNYTAAAGSSVIAVDDALEIADWLNMDGDPLAFAYKLQNQLLPGIIGKSTMIQYAYGDLEVPNPTNSALIRAAGLQSSAWYLRFDLAASQQPQLLGITLPGSTFPALPHAYLSNPTIFDANKAAETSISLATQQQVALYFAVGGIFIPNPNLFLTGTFAGQTLFQINSTLPEQLNFIQIPQ